MYKILIVDDEPDVVSLIKDYLELNGYETLTAYNGEKAMALALQQPDLILLDVNMPHMDGLAVCRGIRDYVSCPILFLTAKTAEADVITGLGLGGDDYLTKPFRLAELRARVNAHLRRQSRTPRSCLRRGELDFDLTGQTVSCRGQAVRLTKSEFVICQHLALRPGQTFTKEQLYEAVFGFDGTGDDSAITEHIKNIRAKLRTVGQEPVETVWGVGYKWKKDGL